MPHPTQNSEQQVLCICFMSCQGHGAWAMTGMKAGTREGNTWPPTLCSEEKSPHQARSGREEERKSEWASSWDLGLVKEKRTQTLQGFQRPSLHAQTDPCHRGARQLLSVHPG